MIRKCFILAAAVTGLATIPAFAQFTQRDGQPPMINVSGSAEVKVVPDQILLQVGVETRDANLDVAKKQNDDQVARALAFLKTNSIQSKDIQTDYINVYPHYHNDDSITPDYYGVRKSINIKLTKLDDFEKIIAGLLNNGVTHVQNVTFNTSELRKHRDTARAMAIKAAREKAEAMTSALGAKLGKVYNINVNEWGGSWSGGYGSYWGGYRGYGGTQNAIQNAGGNSGNLDSDTTSVGQISVSATVNVSFLIK